MLFSGFACGPPALAASGSLLAWLARHRDHHLVAACQALVARAGSRAPRLLAGPTGERNIYALHPREATLSPADAQEALLVQLAGALLVGCRHAAGGAGGPIVTLRRFAPDCADLPLEALVIERSVSTNTAAAGGNASLMTIA